MKVSRRVALSLFGTGVVGLLSCRKTGEGGVASWWEVEGSGDTGTPGTSDSADSACLIADSGDSTPPDTAVSSDTGDSGDVLPEACDPTPPMGLGPFFLKGAPERENLNPLDEKGTRIRIEGRVLSDDCTPLPEAVLDVWHCAPEVAYDMKSKVYRFRARVPLDKDGRFGFETIRPPNYHDEVDGKLHMIVAHIHYLISASGHDLLATQSYFDDDPILSDEPEVLVLSFTDDGTGLLVAQHEIVLSRHVDTGG